MLCQLTAFQKAFVLSLFPAGSRILSARYMQELTPCPIHITVSLPGGAEEQVVLRLGRNFGGVSHEASVFPVLARLGLPVPVVLAGPLSDPQDVVAGKMTLNSLLPGKTLQEWSEQPGGGLEFALKMAVEAISRLHGLTEHLLQEGMGDKLPRKNLFPYLYALMQSGNRWMQEPGVKAATERLAPLVKAVTTPLVFSNGDYQPANFLADDGRLSGFVDFEKACFEDPLITLARYPVYRLNPLDQAGVVSRFLQERGFSEADFAPRLALFCIRTLVTKVPVSGGTLAQQERREHVLSVLGYATSVMNS
jgi:aminoglycoside phosphotransferase (APT) family kinase protein